MFDCILAPEKVPTDVKVKETGKTSITVTWKDISHDKFDKFVQGYTVKYKKKGAASSNFTDVNRVKETVLEGLNKFTEYTIQVAARSTQPGNYSKAISAKTLEDGKPPLLNIVIWETFYYTSLIKLFLSSFSDRYVVANPLQNMVTYLDTA